MDDDEPLEPDESFTLTITPTDPAIIVGPEDRTEIIIVDDDDSSKRHSVEL